MEDRDPIAYVAVKASESELYSLPSPHRHDDILRQYYLKFGKRLVGVQGFLTENGLFINRIQAAKHALKIGQVSKLSHPPLLYSEDLW